MEDSVKERLKLFLRNYNIKAVDFCRSIGVSSGFISGMRESIQPDKLKSIAINYPCLDIGWLLTGIGEMEKVESSNSLLIEELKAEINMLKGENRVLREQVGLGERKGSRSAS
ncbi:hypothetical protein [Bacteroides cellulosilyticus]|jgi:hypothetical protein|uniref:hypothetical protein n=1 Tax=Bacteroides cellulosilyticus TaxID=246787 RepID=UPI0020686EEB|nr:MAG TPA: protein-turn-helix DNA binding protein [Caudoviricetes sp.]